MIKLVLAFFGAEFVLHQMANACERKKVAVFGAGELGLVAKKYLTQSDAQVMCFLDSFIDEDSSFMGIPKINVGRVAEMSEVEIVLLASVAYEEEMLETLQSLNLRDSVRVLSIANCLKF